MILKLKDLKRLERYLDDKLKKYGIAYYFDTIDEKIELLRGKCGLVKKIMVESYEFNIG